VRKFLLVVIALVLAWIFVVPSCSKFGCDSALATAHADDGSCPASLRGAAQDPDWAADRLKTIADRPLTVGLFYDEDGTQHTYTSGRDDDSDLAEEILQDVGATPSRIDTYPAATHVEIKIAALMRENEVDYGVLVINHPGGVCNGEDGMSCQEVLGLVLAPGDTLVVWSSPSIRAGEADVYVGRSG